MKRTFMIVGLCPFLCLEAVDVAGATANSKKAAARQYLSIVAPVNAAANNFIKQVDGWTGATTNARAVTEAKPVE